MGFSEDVKLIRQALDVPGVQLRYEREAFNRILSELERLREERDQWRETSNAASEAHHAVEMERDELQVRLDAALKGRETEIEKVWKPALAERNAALAALRGYSELYEPLAAVLRWAQDDQTLPYDAHKLYRWFVRVSEDARAALSQEES